VLRVGIVGCGKIADSHVEQVRAIGLGEVVAVCDREPLMAEQLAARFAIPSRFTDVAEMLATEALDIVHVATPPDSHVAIACMALEAGCHVFVEKPFALTAEAAATILDTAARCDRRVAVNYLYNFSVPGIQLQELLEAGTLGDLVHCHTTFGYDLAGDYGLAVLSDANHWVHRLPGKLFHNVLDHVVAKVVPLLGDECEVQVMAFRRRAASGIPSLDAMPDELRFLLRSGTTTVSGVLTAHGRPVTHTLDVAGTKGTVELDYASRTIVPAAAQTQPSALGRLFPAWVQARRFAGNGLRNIGRFRRHEFHYFQGMRVLLDRFYRSAMTGGPSPTPPAEVLRVCRIIDAIVVQMRGAA
jgi:predicted dehydrogenase